MTLFDSFPQWGITILLSALTVLYQMTLAAFSVHLDVSPPVLAVVTVALSVEIWQNHALEKAMSNTADISETVYIHETRIIENIIDVPAGIWATNQAVVPGDDPTFSTIALNFDPSDDFHEYRIDWTDSATTFYIDGDQKAQLTTNVPTGELSYIFNVWSSGNPFWSAGPPTTDSITHIQSIES
ncbi:concanavalin A-like lectin/glucanase domain-containing protein [Mycena floridula]|nr:concanavalin A-like lectin/glucanase domain-containing protein [Mycena floridula]